LDILFGGSITIFFSDNGTWYLHILVSENGQTFTKEQLQVAIDRVPVNLGTSYNYIV